MFILPWVHEKFTVKFTMSNVDGYAMYIHIGCLNCPEYVIGCFDFSLPTDNKKCLCAFVTVLGSVLGTLFMIGVALLGWSSFEVDTIQGNG